MAELTAEQAAAAEAAGATSFEISQIENLKRLASQFAVAYSNLIDWAPAVEGTDLEPEHAALVERASVLRDQIAGVMNRVDGMVETVTGWFDKLVDYLPGLGTMRPADVSTLGVVWFIPLAAIGIVATAAGYFLNDYAKFTRRFVEAERIAAELEAEGVPPIEAQRQAAATVAGAVPSFMAGVGSGVGLLILLGGGFLAWRYLQSR